MSFAIAALAALPWLLVPFLAIVRGHRSRTLDEESDVPADPPPQVSVIVPARNERRNIERCVRSISASTYPAIEVIVVDDHSTDGTSALARDVAAADSRIQVIDNPDLPDGWFGKQWACATGASRARGSLLCFTDADTMHAPDLLTRSVNAMLMRGADLLSVAGTQEMRSFWERVLQPQMFFMLTLRYGGTEHVSRARRAEDVIANGQCLFVRRDAYESLGGHAAVRDTVAEDMALAQRFYRGGKRVAVVLGAAQLSTHMYASLGELVRGWGKNVYAGGRQAMLGGALGRLLFPLVLLTLPVLTLAPVIVLLMALAGALGPGWLHWSAISVGATLFWWLLMYGYIDQPRRYAFAYPLGALLLLYIIVGAIARGDRVAWKGRSYRSA